MKTGATLSSGVFSTACRLRILNVKLIVGLGNPGLKYKGTRHNVGFEVIDELASRWAIDLGCEKFHAWYGGGLICGTQCGTQRGTKLGTKVVLLKPLTFMNRSGRSVAAAGKFFKLDLEDLLLIADDIALPLGKLRMRVSGSAGSHNGLQDIIDRVGSPDWCRLRVGIGDRIGDASVFVLSRFGKGERVVIDEAIPLAADAVECWAEHGPESAMNKFNG